jgi:hypothetical protein
MAFKCPNKNSKEWVQLVSKIGPSQAMLEYLKHGDIPIADNYTNQSNKDTFIKEDIASMKKWFEDRFDGESFKVTKKLIDGESFGQFYNGIVTLYENAEHGTGYHEAFHKVSQLYLTPKQRESIYNEVREILGNDLTDLQAEEILAEDFREYMLNGQKTILGQPKRNSIFRRIWNAINNFLFGKTSVQDVYDKLSSSKGYSGKKKLNSYPNLKLNRLSYLNEYKSKEILDDFTSIFYSTMFSGVKHNGSTLTPQAFYELDKDSQLKIVNKNYAVIYETYKKGLAKYKEELKANPGHAAILNSIDIYTNVLNKFEETKAAHITHMVQYGFKLDTKEVEEETATEFVDEVDSDESTTTEIGDDSNPYKPRNEISEVETLTKNTKMLVASSPKMKFQRYRAEDGTVKNRAIFDKNEFGVTKLVNFNDTYNMLSYNLKGLTTESEMYNAILQLGKSNPSLIGIAKKLGHPSEISKSDLKCLYGETLLMISLRLLILVQQQ